MGQSIQKHLMQHAFTTGAIATLSLGRQDHAKYSSALLEAINYKVSPQGALINDTGTVFVNAARFENTKCIIIPFKFSNLQAYILEMGNGYVRFYAANGRIENPPGTPVQLSVPYADTDLSAIQYCQSADFLYIVHPNYPPAYISRSSNISWNYSTIPFTDGPYQDQNSDNSKLMTASGLTGSVTISANYNAFVAGNVGAFIRIEEATSTYHDQWQSGVCWPNNFFVENAGNTYQVTNGSNRSDSNQYDLGSWINATAYPTGYWVKYGQNTYYSTNAATSGNTPPTHTSGTVSDGGVNWTYIGKISGTQPPVHNTGTQSDGNLNWLYVNNGKGYAVITGYTSPTQVTATVIDRLPNSAVNGTVNFRLGAWDSANGYPSTCCIYLQRLTFAGSTNFPETGWMSNVNDYYNFSPTNQGQNVLDTNAITFTLAGGTVNQICWLSPQDRLLIGTIGGEWQVYAEFNTAGFSPTNIQAKQMSEIGSSLNIPVRLCNLSTIYVDRTAQRVYEALYVYVNNLWQSKDQNLFAEHIFRKGGGIVGNAYQRNPYSIMWFLRADGTMVGMTYLKEEEIVAFHEHVYQGQVESIASIPSPDNKTDQLWMVINRTVNGQTVRYIERMQDAFYPNTPQDKANMWYVECGLGFNNGTVVSQIGGLGYLQGLTVVPVVDGAAQPQQVVPASGMITLAVPGTNVVVGLPYTSKATTVPIDFEGTQGTAQGQIKSCPQMKLRLWNSLGFSWAVDSMPSDLGSFTPNFSYNQESFRSSTGKLGQSPDLLTGDYDFTTNMSNSYSGILSVQQTQPYPLNIMAIIYDFTLYQS